MRCYGCFEELNNGLNVCPHCGYVVGTQAEEAIFMEPGSRMRDRYTIGRTIGFGGFGVTYIAWDEVLEQKVAIKEYLPGEFSTRVPGQSQVKVFNGEKTQQFHDGMKEFVDEAKRLAKFQNEKGIVKIFDSFEENNTAYIIMEYLEGGTLTDYIKANGIIDEDTAVEMLMPVMESLKKVHEAGLLHRDIAPDNIFLTKDGEVKLIDFGAARFATTSHSRSLTVIIKPGYSPEEQYRSRGDQGAWTDVYSLAATLYKMLTGVTPPDALERRAKYETKSQDLLEPPKKLNKKISSIRDVALLNALNVRIEDRTPNIDTFISELNAETPAKRIYGKLKKIDLYRWPTWLKGALAAVFVGIVLFGGLLATGVIHFDSLFVNAVEVPAGMVIVPDVEGMSSDKAITKIEKAGLYAITVGNVESEYVEAGKILLQSPSGELFALEGSDVQLTVSSGKGEIVRPEGDMLTMPYIIWDALADAQAKLKDAGFEKIAVTEEYSDSVAAGQVISASIKDGEKVKKGTEVALVISKGMDPAKEAEKAAQQSAAAEENRNNNSNSNNNSNNNFHTHTWVDITETVHHDAVTRVVHHDAVTEDYWVEDSQEEVIGYTKMVRSCGECGATFNYSLAWNETNGGGYFTLEDGNPCADYWYGDGSWDPVPAYMKTHLESHGKNEKGVYFAIPEYISAETGHKKTIPGTGHYETRIISEAYDETVIDQEAWDETVVTGQKCSVCGATK